MSRARKHVTARALGECPEPGENERIMRVVAPRGSNLIEVGSLLGSASSSFAGVNRVNANKSKYLL